MYNNSFNNYNPWETEEQRRQRLLQNGQTSNMYGQTPYQPAPQMTPREIVEQAWDKSAAKQSAINAAKQKDLDATKNMCTWDTIDYFMKKQEAKNQCVQQDSANQNTTPYTPDQQAWQYDQQPEPSSQPTPQPQVDKNIKNNKSIQVDVPEYEANFQRNKNRLCNEAFEGNREYAYLDNAKPAQATVGCGINIDSTNDIQLLNRAIGKQFLPEEQQQELKKLRDSYKENYKAEYYKDKSNIGISEEENERQMRKKYADAYQNLTNIFPKFSSFTTEQQDALLDMNYAMGSGKFNKFKLMKKAIDENNWEEAAYQSHRKGIDERRNDWTAQQLDPEWEKHKHRWY